MEGNGRGFWLDNYGLLWISLRELPLSCLSYVLVPVPFPFPFPCPCPCPWFHSWTLGALARVWGSTLIAGMAEGFDWTIMDRFRMLDFSAWIAAHVPFPFPFSFSFPWPVHGLIHGVNPNGREWQRIFGDEDNYGSLWIVLCYFGLLWIVGFLNMNCRSHTFPFLFFLPCLWVDSWSLGTIAIFFGLISMEGMIGVLGTGTIMNWYGFLNFSTWIAAHIPVPFPFAYCVCLIYEFGTTERVLGLTLMGGVAEGFGFTNRYRWAWIVEFFKLNCLLHTATHVTGCRHQIEFT